MSFDFLTWAFVFVLQAALLGKGMFTLIHLTDLEQDHTNPFDCAVAVNKFVSLEFAVQVILTAVLFLSQKWFSAALHVAILAYLVSVYLKKQVYMDAVDAFKQLKHIKQWRFTVFALYCLSFVFVTYRMVESIIHTVLTPEGRLTAKKLFQEAASSIHGF
ncbi:hypothetical protein CEUSTIGMA_g9115.t1 [Chlamydomonas eustigma]|uniref:Cornichon n=1 Tax=Chlamydomonas eustigma TaxID=1157962 RepID=A0A250XF42_9CHLO|nr:hypothetical protein CEUSTIGMA_g9115.t1 [Chlamydomonas eustigma]|eukprot:GAX81687.1 hypothetical protein CEUSTIGMA_g9115.t1 [Chlamydomonas eustigma]